MFMKQRFINIDAHDDRIHKNTDIRSF